MYLVAENNKLRTSLEIVNSTHLVDFTQSL